MSKPNDKFGSTFYSNDKKKGNKTPPKTESNLRKGHKNLDQKKKISETQNFQEVVLH